MVSEGSLQQGIEKYKNECKQKPHATKKCDVSAKFGLKMSWQKVDDNLYDEYPMSVMHFKDPNY